MTRTLAVAFRALLPDVKISAPECGEWETASVYLNRLLGDPVIAPALDRIETKRLWALESFCRFVRLDASVTGAPPRVSVFRDSQSGNIILVAFNTGVVSVAADLFNGGNIVRTIGAFETSGAGNLRPIVAKPPASLTLARRSVTTVLTR